MANISGTNGADFIHLAGDGLAAPAGSPNTTGATNAADTLSGLGGNDTIYGGTGNGLANTITGNAAANALNGGAGIDRLYGGFYGAPIDSSSLTISGIEVMEKFTGNVTMTAEQLLSVNSASVQKVFLTTITDFTSGGGSADFIEIDSHAALGLVYLGSGAFTATDHVEVRFAGSQILEVDDNGDGTSDFTITVIGVTSATDLSGTDFL